MTEQRVIACGGRTYLVRRNEDRDVGVFDDRGELIFGAPITRPYARRSLFARTAEEWRTIVRALSRGQWELRMATARVLTLAPLRGSHGRAASA